MNAPKSLLTMPQNSPLIAEDSGSDRPRLNALIVIPSLMQVALAFGICR